MLSKYQRDFSCTLTLLRPPSLVLVACWNPKIKTCIHYFFSCVATGSTATIHSALGPVLMLPQAGLIEVWTAEYANSVDDDDERLSMELFVGHLDSKDNQILTDEDKGLL